MLLGFFFFLNEVMFKFLPWTGDIEMACVLAILLQALENVLQRKACSPVSCMEGPFFSFRLAPLKKAQH